MIGLECGCEFVISKQAIDIRLQGLCSKHTVILKHVNSGDRRIAEQGWKEIAALHELVCASNQDDVERVKQRMSYSVRKVIL